MIELGAPVALASRRAAISWSVAAWFFHLGVLVLMSVAFPYQLLGIAYLPVVLSASDHTRIWAGSFSAVDKIPAQIAGRGGLRGSGSGDGGW